MELSQIKERNLNQVSEEDHMALKAKVRDLESCLHEMQEEFEEVNCAINIHTFSVQCAVCLSL